MTSPDGQPLIVITPENEGTGSATILTAPQQNRSASVIALVKSLKKPQLMALCVELGLGARNQERKPALTKKLLTCDAGDDEMQECWEEVLKREASRPPENLATNPSTGSGQLSAASNARVAFRDMIRPFTEGSDMLLYLVNFERTCKRAGVDKAMWSACLLTVLPPKTADILAQLSANEADNYDTVKAALLKRHRLGAEALQKKFRHMTKSEHETYHDLAYRLEICCSQWLEAAEVKTKEEAQALMCLEQFLNALPHSIRVWILDQQKSDLRVSEAATLAEEYANRRGWNTSGDRGRLKPKYVQNKADNVNRKDSTEQSVAHGQRPADPESAKPPENSNIPAEKNKQFEKKARGPRCYGCNERGHVRPECPRTGVLSLLSVNELSLPHSDLELLKPNMTDALLVNDTQCTVLRDNGATYDIIHESLVSPEHYLGKCVWIRQPLLESSICLPVAAVKIVGSASALETEAAVFKHLPLEFPYIFSNRSNLLLKTSGRSFESFSAIQPQMISVTTRSAAKAQKKVAVTPQEQIPQTSVSKSPPQRAGDDLERTIPGPSVPEDADTRQHEVAEPSAQSEVVADSVETADKGADDALVAPGSLLPPASTNLDKLLHVSTNGFAAHQQADRSLDVMWSIAKGLQKSRHPSIVYVVRDNLLFRKYSSKRTGQEYEQLVVPKQFRPQLLKLVHDNPWTGHLGVNKTKERLLTEFYWPKCFKDCENYVRTCNTCQRVGKANERYKAPMKLVATIKEPFHRLIIDIVGPLPKTAAGNRYILTMLCAATRFPEAVPLDVASSSRIVDALLETFSRIGFPKEIQCDNGSVFTSVLTTTFLERCGTRIIHSSIQHPQSNAVERTHSVIKRLLRALCYENKTEWDRGLPATMFALRTIPNASTGFAPAELVFGRNLRTPLRMLKEKWTYPESEQSVVDYVLTLLERLARSQELAEANMREAQMVAKQYYDRGSRNCTYKVGDQVMILKSAKKNKLDVQWDGPVTVTSKISETTYVVRQGRSQLKIYHVNLMKPYKQRVETACITLTVEQRTEADDDFDRTMWEKGPNKPTLPADLSAGQAEQLSAIIDEMHDCFSSTPSKCNLVKFDMEVSTEQDVLSRSYRYSPRQLEIIKEALDSMLSQGIIVPVEHSRYTSPLVIIEKEGKEPRPAVDYRRLNAVTKTAVFPIPNLEERLERVASARYITVLDLVRGYWQVEMTPRAQEYATIVTPFGLFRPVVLPFGLKNAPFFFSMLMARVLQGIEEFALPYLDDVAIFSDTWENHLSHIRDVLQRFRQANLKVKPTKCQFARSTVSYLGHLIGQGERRPCEVKVAAVREFPRPVTKKEVRAFLGLCGYYQHFIPGYAAIASPLTDALRKNEPNIISWNETKQQALDKLKALLEQQSILRAPDYYLPFVIQTDCSDRGMGVVLSQEFEGREHPILFLSRKLTPREELYGASEKECACIVWALSKLSCYVHGGEFTIETDHSPLTWLSNVTNRNPRLLRWSLTLQPYAYRIKYKKGKHHANADGLSRMF